MKFRHELKYQINYSDMIALRSRLKSTLTPDKNGDNGKYKIRSLYFDNIYDSALREKIDGVNQREKFRIRCYNGNNNFIRLEKKSKLNGLCNKISTNLTEEEVRSIISGDISVLQKENDALKEELYIKMHTRGLSPKTIVDYHREAYVLSAGNVRVTLDYDIRTGLNSKDFLNNDSVTVPAGMNIAILEVKWDEYLPDIIKAIVSLGDTSASAFSKYATCRIYG